MFLLHPRLQTDASFVMDWTLSRVLLMNDARFPWLILVPRRENLCELHDLERADRDLLAQEIARASRHLKSIARAEKINIGALGNIVSQLHVHVVARMTGDHAWPGPVWGCGNAIPYEAVARNAVIDRFRSGL